MTKLSPRHDALLQLRLKRDAATALGQYLDGHLEYEDLHDDEKAMLKRYKALTSNFLAMLEGEYERDELLSNHQKTFDVKERTATRDLAFVSSRFKYINKAESELQKMRLIGECHAAIKLAKKEDEHWAQAATAISKNVEVLRRLYGFDKEETGQIDYTKIEQHFNLIIADEMTAKVMLMAIKKDINVQEYNATLDEILKLEAQNIARLEYEKTQNIDYEEI